jgi:hypothetical protein
MHVIITCWKCFGGTAGRRAGTVFPSDRGREAFLPLKRATDEGSTAMLKELRDELKSKILMALNETEDTHENRKKAEEILMKALENPTVVKVLGGMFGNG